MSPDSDVDMPLASGLRPSRTTLSFETLLVGLFFVSGMPALVYQLMWERALFRIFGVNIESVTIVVAAFMLGLGLGSLFGGWLSERPRLRLLPLLAALELGIAAFGLGSLHLFDYVGALVTGWPLAGIAFACLALVLVPTLLMGASLPVLVGTVARRLGRVGDPLGRLYYSNTLGAACACLLGIVVLFPFLGMQASIAVAALVNAAVAAGALAAEFLLKPAAGHEPMSGSSPPAVTRPPVSFVAALLIAFCGGAVALGYEVFFFRVFAFLTGTMAPAFPLVLGAFLAGLANGARRAGGLGGSDADEAGEARAFGVVLRGLAGGAIAGLVFLPLLRWSAPLNHALAMALGLAVIYLAARNWGLLLPYLADRSIAADRTAGRRLSYLYLANILGSAGGSVLTGFVLADRLGLAGMAAALGLAAGLVVLLVGRGMRLPPPSALIAPSRRWTWGTAAAIVALICLEAPLSRGVIDAIQFDPHWPLTDVVENRSGIVTVDAEARVYGGGVYDGQFNIDPMSGTNLIERAYAVQLYRPDPERVLVIGMSSGSWAQVIAGLPAVRSITIVEINPGYARLVEARPMVASLLRDPKVRLVIDDGRRWLNRHPDQTFDLVLSNTSFHFRANASNVLSLEFMDLVRRHLRPGGVLFYNTTGSVRSLVTGCVAFPHGLRVRLFEAVGDAPFALDRERWRRSLLDWRIDGRPVFDLSRPRDREVFSEYLALADDPADPGIPLQSRAIEDCADILARTAGVTPITDDNMGTEWRTILGFPP